MLVVLFLDRISPQRFPVRKDGLPEQLIAYACLVVSPATIPAHFSQVSESYISVCFDTHHLSMVLSREINHEAMLLSL